MATYERALCRCLARVVLARTVAASAGWLLALERLATWGNLSGLLTPEWSELIEDYLREGA